MSCAARKAGPPTARYQPGVDSGNLLAVNDERAILPVSMVIAAGDQIAGVIHAAVALWLTKPPLAEATEVVVAVPDVNVARDPNAAPHLLAELLDVANRSVRLIAPPRTIGGLLRPSGDSPRWTSAAVSAEAEWLDHASIFSPLATSSPIVFVSRFDPNRESSSPVIGAWARFAHPRQRLAAAATNQREGITAEIASAFHPALVLLVITGRGMPLAIASGDQIAVELAARAVADLRQPIQDEADELRVGPWEDPLIQRATELDLGVDWPGALQLTAHWSCSAHDSGHAKAKFVEFVEQIRGRLGIQHPLLIASPNP